MAADDDALWRMKIAARLKALMEDHKGGPLSLAALERLTSGRLAKSRLGNYTQGTRLMGPWEASILGAVFKVPASYILCLDGHMPILTDEERQLISDLRALPERQRKEYMRHLTTLAAEHRDPVPDSRVEQTGYKPKYPLVR